MKVDYQALLNKRDPTPYFEQWKGGHAMLWGYTVSHRILEIRVVRKDGPNHLSIYCGDVQHIHGPTKWDNASFEIETTQAEEVILRDTLAGVEVRAGVLGVDEKE